MLVHAIEADDVMQGLGPMSKFNANWQFLMHLHDIGADRAESWLAAHLDKVGGLAQPQPPPRERLARNAVYGCTGIPPTRNERSTPATIAENRRR